MYHQLNTLEDNSVQFEDSNLDCVLLEHNFSIESQQGKKNGEKAYNYQLQEFSKMARFLLLLFYKLRQLILNK